MVKHHAQGKFRQRRAPLDIHPNCEAPPYISYNEAVPLKPQDPFIFLWMPKVAGMSISTALKHNYGQTYLALENAPNRWHTQLRGVTFYHSHIPALVEAGQIPGPWVDKAFKFAFVRNPWDRMVSLYHWLQWDKKGMSFNEFIQGISLGNYNLPGTKNVRGLYQANRLVDWLRPNGIWYPQWIGRFENLTEDWKIIQKILGFMGSLPKSNASKHTHYRDYYDLHTRELVAKRFEEDIDLFKYTFEA